MRRRASEGASPARAGVLLRRVLVAEVALIACVLGVSGALTGYAPPATAQAGPFSETTTAGPAQLQLTVDPARVGANAIHMYLLNPRDGSQFTAAKEVDVAETLPAKGIGPLHEVAQRAGPGHYIVPAALLGVPGTWRLAVTVRVSDFDEYTTTLKGARAMRPRARFHVQKGITMPRTLVLGILTAEVLLLPAAAQAHVSLHPNVVPAGAFATLDIRVPNEQDNATTTRLAVEFPPGFLDVATQPPPGWRSQVVTMKLATPVKTDEGTIDTQVHEVIWSAGHGAGIPPGQFANFPISVAIPGKQGDTLTFKTVQTYSNRQVVRWIGTPDTDQPAPTIDVSAKGGVLQDVAGGEAGPGPRPAATSAPTAGATTTKVVKESSSNGLAIAALVVAALALAAGVGALIAGRRARARA